MSEETVYPIEASMRGDNTIYVQCELQGCHKNYAICLNTIKSWENGKRKSDDYCSPEIKNKTCPALKMKAEEQAAGHALYYTPRVKVEVKPVTTEVYQTPTYMKQTESYQRGYKGAGAVIKGVSSSDRITATPTRGAVLNTSTQKTPAKSDVINGDLSSVVSQMAKEHYAAKEVKKIEIVEDKPVVESVLDRARRLREQRMKV